MPQPDNLPQLMLWLIGICLTLMLAPVFFGSVRGLLRAVARGGAGLLAAYALNLAAAPLGLAVGLNALTAVVTGLLGLPGLITLYTARFLL